MGFDRNPEWAKTIRRYASEMQIEICPYEPVDSIVWKFNLAQYHRSQLDKLLRIQCKAVRWAQNRVERFKYALEANVCGHSHALHSLSDLLAQLINKSVIDLIPCESNVSAKKLLEKAEKSGEQGLPSVGALQNLCASGCHQYLEGFVNSIKHRRAIESSRTFSAEKQKMTGGTGFVGIYLLGFAYNGHVYEPLRVEDYLGMCETGLIPHAMQCIESVIGEVKNRKN